jgi:hypothetical protein
VPPSDSARFREGTLPAGAFDVLDELGDELVAEVRPEVPRVQLHVPLQHDVEEHLASLALLRSRRRGAARLLQLGASGIASLLKTRIINP